MVGHCYDNHHHICSQGPLNGVACQDGGFQASVRCRPSDDEVLDNSEITCFEIDGICLRIDYLTHLLVNLVGNCTPTDDIVQVLGRPAAVSDVDSQWTVCAIRYAPKLYSGECGRPSFEIKEEQLSFLIDQSFQVPVIAQCFRVSARTIERRMAKYGLSISGKLSTTVYFNCHSYYVHMFMKCYSFIKY